MEARPPVRRLGAAAWLRANLFSSPGNAALTVVTLAAIAWFLPPLIAWALVEATWSGTGRADCLAEGAGACWPFISNRIGQIVYGFYPEAERWRVNIVFALGVTGVMWMALPRLPRRGSAAVLMLTLFPAAAFVLLSGGPGLVEVPTSRWGGLLLTMVIAMTGIVVSLPLGIVLALGRRSELPVVRMLCVVFIEFVRGVPLITVLFMASNVLPLFMPQGLAIDKLLRALIAVALFSSAYMAEVVRGGLQAVPRGQYEAAQALGLGYWRMHALVILPQALRTVLPSIVNTFIGLFKDTSLVAIIGFFDLLGIIQSGLSDPEWSTPQTPFTGYIFAAAVFWAFCYGMSRYARGLERRLTRADARGVAA